LRDLNYTVGNHQLKQPFINQHVANGNILTDNKNKRENAMD
jgi:hypothetical protein